MSNKTFQRIDSADIPLLATRILRKCFTDYDSTRAHEYYKLARDKKLASLCYLMTAECKYQFRKYRADATGMDYPTEYDSRYGRLLKQKGFDTDYYKELIKECETYAGYRDQLRQLQP